MTAAGQLMLWLAATLLLGLPQPIGGAAGESSRDPIRSVRLEVLEELPAARHQPEVLTQRTVTQRADDVAERRRALSETYGHLPTIDELYEVARRVPSIGERTTTGDRVQFVVAARRIGFELSDPGDQLFSDINRFGNRHGVILETWRVRGSSGEWIFTADLKVENASTAVVELYDAELRAGYRDMRKSTPEGPRKGPLPTTSAKFIKSGGTIYSYTVEKGTLTVQAMLNNRGEAAIVAERTGPDGLRVNSYVRFTDVELRRGDRLRLTASGTVTLGPFVGKTGPEGIGGFPTFRRNQRFQLGALMARVGEGEWFLVKDGIFAAQEDGTLQLRINDNDPDNNDGAFEVRYSFLTPDL
jgi:hypothetical protein